MDIYLTVLNIYVLLKYTMYNFVNIVIPLNISTSFSELPATLSLIGSASVSSSGLILTQSEMSQRGAMVVKSQFPYLSHTSFSIQYQTTTVCGYLCADGIALVIGPYASLAASSDTYSGLYESNCPTGMFCVQQCEYETFFRINVGGTVIQSVSPTDMTDGERKNISVTFHYGSGVTVVYQGTGGETYNLTATASQLSVLNSFSIYGVMLYSRTGWYYATHTINKFKMLVSFKSMSPTSIPTSGDR
jgi:hypothetical protein